MYSYMLNFPWYLYPTHKLANICTGWQRFDEYKEEVVRLYNFIQNMEISENTILYVAIGAAMEELNTYNNQYMHLLPYYLQKVNDFPIRIIIISPNDGFSNQSYHNPSFIYMTKNIYGWVRTNDKQYTSHDNRIVVDIFCTPIPSYDKRNEEIINYIEKYDTKKEYDKMMCDMIQTLKDRQFISNFYQNLERLFDKINE